MFDFTNLEVILKMYVILCDSNARTGTNYQITIYFTEQNMNL